MSEPAQTSGPRLHRPRSFRRLYGSNPLHLLIVVLAVALAGLAVSRWVIAPTPLRLFVWFAAAVIGHDLVAAPVYSGLDRLLVRVVGGRPDVDGQLEAWRRAAVNHVRIPVVLSLLLLAMWFPLIFARGDATYFAASGRHQTGYAGHYLLVVAVLFGGSLLIFLLRLLRAGGRSRTAASPPRS